MQWQVLLAVTTSIIISLLALLATFYQLRLQRIHNEKSVKPLVQIDLPDRKNQIAVHIRNNGLGPLIIDRLTFIKNDNTYTSIADCLDLDPKSYMHVSVNDAVKRVVLPNSHLVVFEKNLENHTEEEIRRIREELTPITLQMDGRDIYDNTITFKRNFEWFSRYSKSKITDISAVEAH